ncbi:hypothetical protein DY037_07120 [Apilactobacillus micheneri]|uniref:hypothetical protein n=1 Tax=Apilactobacillus micheneri TaxID=1899430 RepID=UPI00112E0C0E|nr:hypothetical protein [Apilactobacillus micheneri]TPR48156.1 hypothetical protein DY037_07120 [Apilactobacillus micheneri]
MKDKLLRAIKGRGFSVSDLVFKMNREYKVKIATRTFYKKLNDFDRFRLPEIQAITLILGLDVKEAEDIFFPEVVA